MLNKKFSDEAGRQAALERYEVLDTPAEEPFDKITSLVRAVLDVPICAVTLIDRERQWFKSIQGLDASETPRSISFCTHTIQDEKPLLVADAGEDERFKANPFVVGAPHVRSYLGAPLRTPDGYNLGALCAIDTVPRQFTKAQLDIVTNFASLVVDELELRRIAERDHLTGSLSRRGLISRLEKEIKRFQRYQRPSAFLMMDIDHFKSVNDRFGHPTGDKVLKAVAAACSQQLRANDFMGRLGGEEFGILLSETDEAGAWSAAEKIRRSIENLLVPAGGGIGVTASFGLAAMNFEVATAEDWVATADEALYCAKRSGRNRCVITSRPKQIAAA
jgi:diguanylate cyclase (GGDEF)-like protein